MKKSKISEKIEILKENVVKYYIDSLLEHGNDEQMPNTPKLTYLIKKILDMREKTKEGRITVSDLVWANDQFNEIKHLSKNKEYLTWD